MDDQLRAAADALADSDAILIGAGAGMGVDSGLPDFRGPEGFWRAYPPYKALGLRFEEMADPVWFRRDARLAWGFYGHRLGLYRQTTPHAGFDVLRRLSGITSHGSFVYTSNVDGQFQRAGWTEPDVNEVHGSIHWLQCAGDCEGVWPAEGTQIAVDSASFRAEGPLPTCPGCDGVARPNILMFGDWGFLGDRASTQARRYQAWGGSVPPSRLTVVELGAGTAVPTVRWESERWLRAGARVVRINPRESHGPAGVIGVALGALEALSRIGELLGLGAAALIALLALQPAQAQEPQRPAGAVVRFGTHRLRHAGAVTGLVWHPGGRRLFSCGDDRVVREWDGATGSPLGRYSGADEGLGAIAISADGAWIAAAGRGRRRAVWRVGRGSRPAVRADVPQRALACLSFAAQDLLVSAGPAAELRALAPGSDAVHVGIGAPFAAGPDGRTVVGVIGTGLIGACRLSDGARRWTLRATPTALCWSGDGRRVVVGEVGAARVVDAKDGRVVRVLPAPAGRASVAVSADGRFVAVGGSGARQILVWDTATWRVVARISQRSWVKALAFRPDGQVLASADGRAVQQWRTVGGAAALPENGHVGPVSVIVADPTGRVVATGSSDCTVRLWDARTGAQVRVLTGHTQAVTGLAFGPRGQLLYSTSRDGSVRRWSTRPPAQTAPEAVERLVVQLGSARFKLRQAATRDLERLGDAALAGLRRHTGAADPEVRQRVLALIERLQVVARSDDAALALAVSPTGKHVAWSTARHVRLATLGTSPAVSEMTGTAERLQFRADGAVLATARERDPVVFRRVPGLAVLQGRTAGLARGSAGALGWDSGGGLSLVRLGTPVLIVRLSPMDARSPGRRHRVAMLGVAAALSPGARRAVVSRNWSELVVIDVSTGAVVQRVACAANALLGGVAWSADGRRFLAGRADTVVLGWRVVD